MTIADPALDEATGQQLAVTVNPASAEKFFEGSGHTFKDLLALSTAGRVLPRFAVPSSIRATVATESASLRSDNVVGILPGTDPVLKDEYIVVSAHLDHVGVGTMDGDRIYNGAMDNASGIATLIETAAAAAAKKGFKRSVIFLAVTAEEKGLLGSRFFASKPTVAKTSLVADLNTDMFLPLFPLKSLIVQGLEESDLAADLQRAARPMGIEVYSDPEPERNAFVRSDQVQLHPQRCAVRLAEGRLRQGLSGARAGEEVAHRTVPRAVGRFDAADRSKGGRGFQQGLRRAARSRGEPSDAAGVERQQLLPEVRGRQLARNCT